MQTLIGVRECPARLQLLLVTCVGKQCRPKHTAMLVALNLIITMQALCTSRQVTHQHQLLQSLCTT
jgi:hypothetical protein